MTEALHGMMNQKYVPLESVAVQPAERPTNKRVENFMKHGLPILGIGALALAGLTSGIAYEFNGPKHEVAHDTTPLTDGETPIDAARLAAMTIEEKTGIHLNESDVTYAAQNAKLSDNGSRFVHPQNIDMIVTESPILHTQQITIVPTNSLK